MYVDPRGYGFARALGIDISAEAIKQGRQKRPRVRLLQSTAEEYQLQAHEHKYGMIVFNEVIYYLDHVSAAR